ncbi:MAG TPA: putative sulfate exporter family transporter, partial [Paludibacter sp.]
WFILFFILAMVLNTYLDFPKQITHSIVLVSRQSLTLTLFFIGAGLSRSTIKSVGIKPLVLGISLWFFIAFISLLFICFLY